MKKTTTTPTIGSPSKSTSTPGFSFQLLSPNRHLGATKGEEEMLPEQINIGVGSSSSTTTSYMSAPTSRWNPTQEQLLALEDMYRRGMRTPTADQIQQIASQLQRFGKIEGKNVFYWFQNHKARERQKRRREGENNSKMQMKDAGIPGDIKDYSGMRRTVQKRHHHTKDLATSSNCTKNKQGLVPMHGKSAKAENRTHGGLQFEERELLEQTKRNLVNDDTWQKGFCPSSSTYSPPIFHVSSTKIQALYGQYNNISNTTEDEEREIQTLQLFPLGKENNVHEDYKAMVNKCSKEDTKVPITTINANFSPSQFFEFLPLKN